MSVEFANRSPNDHARLRLVISLIRNVLAIEEKRENAVCSGQTYHTASSQEELVKLLKDEEVIDFLLSLGGSSSDFEFKIWNTLVLEIFYHIFYRRSINDIIPIQVARKESTNKLSALLSKEKAKSKGKARHSRFGGTFALKTTVIFI